MNPDGIMRSARKTTKDGSPRHPLYLPDTTPLEPFTADHPRSRAVRG